MPELIAHVHIDGEHYAPGDEVPADVAKRLTNPKLWANVVSADKAAEGYEQLTVEELKAEIDLRNSRRDEAGQITPEGTRKADLVAALEDDDRD